MVELVLMSFNGLLVYLYALLQFTGLSIFSENQILVTFRLISQPYGNCEDEYIKYMI